VMLPASTDSLKAYAQAQAKDHICSKLIEFCKLGWPTRNQFCREFKEYWSLQGNLILCDALLMYQTCIVVPPCMCQKTLEKIHHGHQGIQRSKLRVASSIWWPGVSKAVENFIHSHVLPAKSSQYHLESHF